jgi:hypothetical protein
MNAKMTLAKLIVQTGKEIGYWVVGLKAYLSIGLQQGLFPSLYN